MWQGRWETKQKKNSWLPSFVESKQGCIRDYREWLVKQGIDTTGMLAMGSTESVMIQIAYRVKYRRSWSTKGMRAFFKVWIARTDGIGIRLRPRWKEAANASKPAIETKDSMVVRAKKRVRAAMPDVVRNNVPYLQQSLGTIMHEVLLNLRGW